MKKAFLRTLIVLVAGAQLALAHDPRTVAKDFSHTMSIEGAGKLTLSYKSLHYNEAAYLSVKQNERTLTNLNRLWKKIGKLDTDFDVMIGDVRVPKGSYDLGFNFDAKDNFKLVLGGAGNEITIPLMAQTDGPVVNYLSFDLRPENATDTFTFEGRYGKIRTSAPLKVPYLAEQHDHAGEQKPAEKKP
ncbi:MAG TPA: hypothetical protein VNH22_06345 [Blastocatellia bacterium]|jgi:hypothetical protein|nr:hypothetical protein [Blastocatellia bacterium]